MRLVPALVLLGCGSTPAPLARPEPMTRSRPESMATPVAIPMPTPTEASWQPPAQEPDGPAMPVAGAEPERCSIRVGASGIRVDGEVVTRQAAVAACKRRRAALVEVSDDAASLWSELRAALDAARIPILMRGAPAHEDCSSNPLARGCM